MCNMIKSLTDESIDEEIKKCCCEGKIEKIEESISALNEKIKKLEIKIQILENDCKQNKKTMKYLIY